MNSTAVITYRHLPAGRIAHQAEVYGVNGPRRVPRLARPADMRTIAELVRPCAEHRVLIARDLISYFEDIQGLTAAKEIPDVVEPGGIDSGDASAASRIVGCRALHVVWNDIAEVRTLAAHSDALGTGFGSATLHELVTQAREMGFKRVFCVTFEEQFFGTHGFEPVEGTPVGADVFTEILRSHGGGLTEFLDLACVKPNILGNARILLHP